MERLSDHFSKFICMHLKNRFGIEMVAEAQSIDDKFLLQTPYIGPKFIEKLRAIVVEPYKKVVVWNTDILVRGLTVRQRNAIVQAFTSGLINEIVNARYMVDIFSGDQIHVIPQHRQETTDSVSYIEYLSVS
jgi:hypothetical protein